ncbi:ubiquinol-cytochrome c reductase iron-sulfur subunit [Haloarcula sp. CBA1131]|uniref:Rieske 2Fe-2S domain-containing protein n=1 Tax=Haloarcula sp. CBA1131 TaxID=1853686 RepID=UPI001246C304|nr:Rieske 2Fe-2S domain-containing protein [Haloarcula sp. CBA1131]KAA9407946.1 ubiquinol-cytochrome c reductase iron-sulfur subunit [Haloarcula sp. CBA1131]
MTQEAPPNHGQRDKYPAPSGRRRFVKGLVGASALSGVTTVGGLAVDAATDQGGVGGGTVSYIGIQNIAGPANRPMPLVPLEISDGALRGKWPSVSEVTAGGDTFRIAKAELGGVTYSQQWFQYCGLEVAAGLEPDPERDGFLRSKAAYDWQSQLNDGDKLRVEHFEDYESWGNDIGSDGLGKPAVATWRSQGEDVKEIQVQVFRTPAVSKMVAGDDEYADLAGEIREFLDAATAKDFIAWVNRCTHLCCNPGYKTMPGSAKFEAADKVYCNCHQSVYDPFSPTTATFASRPRPQG